MQSNDLFNQPGAPIDDCYQVQHAIEFSCPECGAAAGDYCTSTTRTDRALRVPHPKRLLVGRKKYNIKYPFCSGFEIRKKINGETYPYVIQKGDHHVW